jgi:transposase
MSRRSRSTAQVERSASRCAESRIEIALAGGHSLRISGAYDPDTLARLIRGLSS